MPLPSPVPAFLLPRRDRVPRPWAVSNAGLWAATLALGIAVVLFGLFPSLDLAVAGLVYAGNNRFVGQTPLGAALRHLFYWTPFALFAVMPGLAAAQRFGRLKVWAPSGRGLLFLALSLALGPGLLVNTVLKDHWHRPRPVQVSQFGGTMPFRPFYRTDGACTRNCSFVSGEGATAVWCIAPALLLPEPARTPALAGAVLFGLATSLLRIAFGGHFLSDSVLAALLSWLVVIAAWRIAAAGRGATIC